MKEQNETPKNNWSRIFKKKWFFPAVYLTVAALLLSVVVWYQNVDTLPNTAQEDNPTEDYQPIEHGEDEATEVVDQEEVIKMPVADQDQAEIVTKFYDYDANDEDQEQALIHQNNRFYQSTGIDIASVEGDAFDVLAALSGTVTEVKSDPLLGNVVVLTHDNEVMTYYSSLTDVQVKAGSRIKQGDKIARSGKSQFGKDNGIHVHFEIRKAGEKMNPETYFNQPVSKLEQNSQSVAEEVSEDRLEQEEYEGRMEDKLTP